LIRLLTSEKQNSTLNLLQIILKQKNKFNGRYKFKEDIAITKNLDNEAFSWFARVNSFNITLQIEWQASGTYSG
jgi:hypothetical protein